jgi:hypothetical protein
MKIGIQNADGKPDARDATPEELSAIQIEVSNWLHDFALRIIVPKSILQANRQLLIFKSYAEIMGLPYEILPDEVHFYCNEILDDDKPTIAHFNLTVEER